MHFWCGSSIAAITIHYLHWIVIHFIVSLICPININRFGRTVLHGLFIVLLTIYVRKYGLSIRGLTRDFPETNVEPLFSHCVYQLPYKFFTAFRGTLRGLYCLWASAQSRCEFSISDGVSKVSLPVFPIRFSWSYAMRYQFDRHNVHIWSKEEDA